jgi:hypothetical protein
VRHRLGGVVGLGFDGLNEGQQREDVVARQGLGHPEQPGSGFIGDGRAVGQVMLGGNEVEVGQRVGHVRPAQNQLVHELRLGGAEFPGEPGTEGIADHVKPAGRVAGLQRPGSGVER